MIRVIAKSAPPLWGLFGLAVLLGFLFWINWLMSDIIGDTVVKYSDECVVGEYNYEYNTGSLTCGEYVKNDGNDVIKGFVGKVYIKKNSIYCQIEENEYTGSTNWDCEEMLSDENEVVSFHFVLPDSKADLLKLHNGYKNNS